LLQRDFDCHGRDGWSTNVFNCEKAAYPRARQNLDFGIYQTADTSTDNASVDFFALSAKLRLPFCRQIGTIFGGMPFRRQQAGAGARFWTEMIMDDRALRSNAMKFSLFLLTIALVASAQAGNNNNNNNNHVTRSAGSNSGAYHNAYHGSYQNGYHGAYHNGYHGSYQGASHGVHEGGYHSAYFHGGRYYAGGYYHGHYYRSGYYPDDSPFFVGFVPVPVAPLPFPFLPVPVPGY
jgi:hypothetical protein